MKRWGVALGAAIALVVACTDYDEEREPVVEPDASLGDAAPSLDGSSIDTDAMTDAVADSSSSDATVDAPSCVPAKACRDALGAKVKNTCGTTYQVCLADCGGGGESSPCGQSCKANYNQCVVPPQEACVECAKEQSPPACDATEDCKVVLL
jgi:hypothetical protein